jgi:hypothetical protein
MDLCRVQDEKSGTPPIGRRAKSMMWHEMTPQLDWHVIEAQ